MCIRDRFVIIENEEQIPHIRFSNIVAYLMVEEDGTVSVIDAENEE